MMNDTILARSPSVVNKQIYKTLEQSIDTYLTKIPATKIINILPKNVIKRKLFYISKTSGHVKGETSSTYAKTSNKKLQAIVLNARQLGIQFDTGHTSNIDKVIEELTRSVIIFILSTHYTVNAKFKLKMSKVITDFICSEITADDGVYHHIHVLVLNKLFKIGIKRASGMVFKDQNNSTNAQLFDTIQSTYDQSYVFPSIIKNIFGINYTPDPMINFSEKYTRIVANMVLVNDRTNRLKDKSFINELIAKSNKIEYDMSPIILKTISE